MTRTAPTPSPATIPRPQWRLRPALPTDAASLHQHCMAHQDAAFIQRILRHCQQAALNQRGLGLVAVLPGEIPIGFGQLTLWPRTAEISDLIVSETWRGQGIGTAIIHKLIAAAQEMDTNRVEIGVALRNYRALLLYRRIGFNYGRTVDLDLGDGSEPVMYLWMALNEQADR